MEFFNSLTLDLKMLIVGIAGCALLALFSGNRNTEKRYLLVLAVLTAVGIYRFNRMEEVAGTAVAAAPHFVKAHTQHTPIVSTSAR